MEIEKKGTISERSIVLVYLGKRLPSYLIKNLEYLCNSQNREIILVTDTGSRGYTKNARNLRVVDARRFFDGWRTLNKSKYRDFFWDKTLKRLYILFRFMEEEAIAECIHIEGDVWVAPYANLDFELEKNTCMYPQMSNNRGVGSIMFIQNEGNRTVQEALKLMSQYPNQTDMQILGTLLQIRPDVFKALPSKPESNFYGKDLFDGAVFGMHIFGEHARNRFGFYKIFHQYDDAAIDWHGIELELNASFQLILSYGGCEYVLNTLHLHSKSQKLFSDDWRKALSSQLENRNRIGGEITKFSFRGLIESILDYSKLVIPYFRGKIRL